MEDQYLDVVVDDLDSHPHCPHDIHYVYGLADGNSRQAQRIYQERFPMRRIPHYQFFMRIHNRLRATGSIQVLKPLETNAKEAQYLFSQKATHTIVNAARNIGIKSFICMGTPRVHEFVNADDKGGLQSLLLDIDKRYHNFCKPQEFCWFNSFNNHFFLGDSAKMVLMDYLKQNGGKDMMIVMDPPFGGRIEPLSYTIKEIQRLHHQLNPNIEEDMRVMFISPYFMELHILASFPDFQMLDYKVAYDNHPLFSQGAKARKLGSPVRIFTNIVPKDVPLPQEEGYWFCGPCERWVSQENRHCDDCKKCTSKNGHTYVHCSKCQRCVKPSWEHCDRCKRCCLVPHTCGSFEPLGVCYKCGEAGHKKYNCPKLGGDSETAVGRKRKPKQRRKICKRSKRDPEKED